VHILTKNTPRYGRGVARAGIAHAHAHAHDVGRSTDEQAVGREGVSRPLAVALRADRKPVVAGYECRRSRLRVPS